MPGYVGVDVVSFRWVIWNFIYKKVHTLLPFEITWSEIWSEEFVSKYQIMSWNPPGAFVHIHIIIFKSYFFIQNCLFYAYLTNIFLMHCAMYHNCLYLNISNIFNWYWYEITYFKCAQLLAYNMFISILYLTSKTVIGRKSLK